MVDTHGMAVLDCTGDLSKHRFDSGLVPHKPSSFCDCEEQIALDPAVQHHVETVVFLYYLV